MERWRPLNKTGHRGGRASWRDDALSLKQDTEEGGRHGEMTPSQKEHLLENKRRGLWTGKLKGNKDIESQMVQNKPNGY